MATKLKIMKNILLCIMFIATLSFSSCIKSEKIIYTDSELEWDAATYNANAAGVTYPILTRVAGYGRAVVTSDPTITRTSGSIKFRVNLVGAQRSTPTTITYVVLNSISTAVAGTHYNTSGSFIIPANSSFGEVQVDVINPGVTSGSKDLVLELVPTSDIKVSANDRDLGIRIAQN
ncbi:MAG: DUF4843 domain-containing protein [Sphingobacteriaceae bacterium]|nr:MAG: DUF4843 domain-containing protein [Sphingobacteriaceae bacterium]